MTIDTLIMLAGTAVAILPFLGFPNNWDSALFFFLGILVIALGIVVRRRESHIALKRPERRAGTFTEHMPEDKNPPEREGMHDVA